MNPSPAPSLERPFAPGQHLLHAKGGRYVVEGYATHTEDDELLILYHRLEAPQERLARPVHMLSQPMADGQRRFTPIAAPDGAQNVQT